MTLKQLLDMTDAELQVKVAECAGWTNIKNANTMAMQGAWVGYPPKRQIIGKKQPLPDYTNSLDAMAEVEATLSLDDGSKSKYIHILEIMCGNAMFAIFASARLRAIAYVATKIIREIA